MSSRTCPDWPELTELAPDLQFKHYTVAEARLPADALVQLGDFPLGAVAICADLDKNVFYAQHTDPKVAEALRDTHWYEVREWATTGPGREARSRSSTFGASPSRTRDDFAVRLKTEGGPRPDP